MEQEKERLSVSTQRCLHRGVCTVQSREMTVERMDEVHQNPNITLCIGALVFHFDCKV